MKFEESICSEASVTFLTMELYNETPQGRISFSRNQSSAGLLKIRLKIKNHSGQLLIRFLIVNICHQLNTHTLVSKVLKYIGDNI